MAKTKPSATRVKRLTPKEQLFVDRYVIHWNGSRAVREAGYDTVAPHIYANRLLSKAYIQARVEKAREIVDKINEQAAHQATAFLLEQLRADPRRLVGEDGRPLPVKQIGDDEASLINGVDFEDGVVSKLRLADRRAAADSILKVVAEQKRMAEKRLGPREGEVLPPEQLTDDQDDMITVARRIAFALALGARAKEKAKLITKK